MTERSGGPQHVPHSPGPSDDKRVARRRSDDKRVARRRLAALAALACALSAALGLAACAPSVLEVGPARGIKSPGRAMAEARSGDTVRIDPGVYRDCAVVKGNRVTIEGAGPGVVLTDRICAGKAILVTQGNDITVRNLTLQRAHVPARNGAGIRAEGANLTVDHVRFLDNENGILAASNRGSTIRILDSDFERNGTCEGPAGCAHGVYGNSIALLDIENSRFFDQRMGHHVKSRARSTVVRNSRIEDGPDGTASYEIDVPNGGDLLVEGNTIEKGPKATNRSAAIAIGEEGTNQPSRLQVIRDNNFTNNNPRQTVFVHNSGPVPVRLEGNVLRGDVVPLQGPGTVQ